MTNKTHINIDPSTLATQECPDCKGVACCDVFNLKHLPALLSPTGKAQVIKIQVGYACTNCGESMFVQPDLEKEETAEKAPFLEIIPR